MLSFIRRSGKPSSLAYYAASLLILAAAGIAQIRSVFPMDLPAWDEAGHGIRAQAFAHFIRYGPADGFWGLFLTSDIYPPLGRLGMSLGILVCGDSWESTRLATAAAWICAMALCAILAARAAPPSLAPMAVFGTLVFALSGWLPVAYGRTALLEPWCLLSLSAAALSLVILADHKTKKAAVAAGLLVFASVLVKYNYGAMMVLAAGAWLLSRAAAERRLPLPPATLAAFLLAIALPAAWWFIIPYPFHYTFGTAHREAFLGFFNSSTELSFLEIPELIYVFPFVICISIPSCLLQLSGMGFAIWNWRDRAASICSILFLGGQAAFLLYPYRLDRFLLPTLFPLWIFGGVATSIFIFWITKNLPRPLAHAAFIVILLISAAPVGVGAWSMVHYSLSERGYSNAMIDRRVRRWLRPYDPLGGNAPAPRSYLNDVLELATENLDANRSFAWIGGNGGVMNVALVRWELYKKSKISDLLLNPAGGEMELMGSPDWNEKEFEDWASRHEQVVYLQLQESPARGVEPKFGGWLAVHPGFLLKSKARVVEADGGERALFFYEKKR